VPALRIASAADKHYSLGELRTSMRLPSAKRRVPYALSLFGGTCLVCLTIAAWSPAGIIANAVLILVVSLAGFHAAVWFSHERKLAWQMLDYALELITVVALIAALAGIQQSAVAEALQAEFSRRKADQANLVYFIKSTITNDCHPKESRKDMWTPSPEPYDGACDRIEHFLPQIEYVFGKETGVETMTADDSWARDLLINDETATGSWRGLYDEAKRFMEGSRRTRHVLDTQGQLSSEFIKTLAGSGKLRYWQYLLALALGLRIARRTGGLLDGRAKERVAQRNEREHAASTAQESGTA
jgi:hypothetical protein